MTKSEKARLEAEFKANWRRALEWQEATEQYISPATMKVRWEMAAMARGYGEALRDMLAWHMDEEEIHHHMHALIVEAEESTGIKTSISINPMGW